MRFAVDMVEDLVRAGRTELHRTGAEVFCSIRSLRLDLSEELPCSTPVGKERAHPDDRIAFGPRLLFIGAAVLRGVVPRRVRSQAVRHGLDRARAEPGSR